MASTFCSSPTGSEGVAAAVAAAVVATALPQAGPGDCDERSGLSSEEAEVEPVSHDRPAGVDALSCGNGAVSGRAGEGVSGGSSDV